MVREGKSTKKAAPISRHPAFPAIVALWFAALLGIGSLVLPVVLFERLFAVTGIASVVPAAAAPLGVTARILIALGGAALGTVAGLFVARKVVAAQEAAQAPAPRVRRTVEEAPRAKKPISAHEELGSKGLDEPLADGPPPIAGRRRALSVTDESGRSELLDTAPLPGPGFDLTFEGAPATDFGAGLHLAESDRLVEDDVPLELDQSFEDLSVEEPEIAAGVVPHDDVARVDETFAIPTYDQETMTMTEPFASRPFDAPAPEATAEDDGADLAALRNAAPPAPLAEEPAVAFEAAPEPASRDRGDLAGRPLAELSMAELVERFAHSLRNAPMAAAAEPEAAAPAPASTPARYVPDLGVLAQEAPRFEPEAPAFVAEEAPAETVEIAQDAPASEPVAAAIPAALQPVSFDDDDGEEDLPPLTLPSLGSHRPFAQPAPATAQALPVFTETDEDEADSEDCGDGYSSLLAMRGRVAQEREAIRIDDEDDGSGEDIEPAVVFPGERVNRPASLETGAPIDEPDAPRPFDAPGAPAPAAAIDQSEAERALRDALRKLQRMSGAA